MLSKQNPNHIYMDIQVTNNDYLNQYANIPLSFQERKSTTILGKANEWYMSIIRFNVSTLNIPVWIPLCQMTNDVKTSIYSFSMSYKGVVHQEYLFFIPQDRSIQEPPFVSGAPQNITSGYYNVFSYAYIINSLFNTTLNDCWKNFLQKLTDAEIDLPAPNVLNTPFYNYDPTSSEIILNVPQSNFYAEDGDCVQLFCNTPMYNLMNSFEFLKVSTNDPNGCNYQFNIYPINTTNIIELDTNYIQLYQEYSSISSFGVVSSIVFVSPDLFISPTIIERNKQFGEMTTSINTNGMMNTLNIITDIDISGLNKDIYPSMSYIPQGEYRLIDLLSSDTLSNFRIDIYYKDIYQNYHQLYLNSGQDSSIKLMFRRKSFNL